MSNIYVTALLVCLSLSSLSSLSIFVCVCSLWYFQNICLLLSPPLAEIILTCYIVNTSEYCNDTLPGLCDRLLQLFEGDEFKEQVDLGSNSEELNILANKAIQIIIQHVFTKINKILTNFIKMSWRLVPYTHTHTPTHRQKQL